MAEEKPRVQKVLEELYQTEGTIRPKEIADKLGESSLNTGKDLHRLKERGLAETESEGQWKITAEGKEWLEAAKGAKEKGREIPEIADTVPSQADLLISIGERLNIGKGKGSVPLTAIRYFVEKTANLDDLNSVWNALTEMDVANHAKKRWIKLYAQTIPGKEIPSELKAKLEAGTEAEKVANAEAGEIPPKPKRFSVVNDQIIGDPEGDLNFKEALQLLAQQKGVPSAQANPLAAMVEAMKLGPDMATATLTTMIPLITKDSGEDSVIKLILTQMGDLQKEMREGQKSSPEIQALTQQLDQLRDTLHNEQLARIQEQNQATAKEMLTLIGNLQQQIKGVAEGKQAESKIGLMSKALDKGAEQLSGIRTDIKPVIQSFVEGKAAPPKKRNAREKTGFGAGLDKGIERAKEATALENDLFFGKES